MPSIDWDSFDLEQLTEMLREKVQGADAEKMIWAFEEAVRTARIDEELLGCVLVATVCLLARLHESTPRSVLEAFFRRSVSDEEWRRSYLPLFS